MPRSEPLTCLSLALTVGLTCVTLGGAVGLQAASQGSRRSRAYAYRTPDRRCQGQRSSAVCL